MSENKLSCYWKNLYWFVEVEVEGELKRFNYRSYNEYGSTPRKQAIADLEQIIGGSYKLFTLKKTTKYNYLNGQF